MTLETIEKKVRSGKEEIYLPESQFNNFIRSCIERKNPRIIVPHAKRTGAVNVEGAIVYTDGNKPLGERLESMGLSDT